MVNQTGAMGLQDSFNPLPRLVRVDEFVVTDRRAHERHSFPLLQQVRPLVIGELDGRSRFVRCHDLSEDGIAFWSHESFWTDRIMIALGENGSEVEVPAEVCHTTGLSCLRDPLYLIGCRFTRGA